MPDATSTPQGLARSIRSAHVIFVQPASQNQRPCKVRGPSPIICLAIDQNGFGGRVIGKRGLRIFNPECFPYANAPRMPFRRFAAVELRDVEPKLRGDPFDRAGRFVHKYAHLPDLRGELVRPSVPIAQR